MFHSQTKHLFEHPSTLVSDRKFDTALRSSTVNNVRDRLDSNNGTLDDMCLDAIMNKCNIKFSESNVNNLIFSSMLSDWFSFQHYYHSTCKLGKKQLVSVVDLSSKNFSVQYSNIRNGVKDVPMINLDIHCGEINKKLLRDERIHLLMGLITFWSELVENLNQMDGEAKSYRTLDDYIHAVTTKNVCMNKELKLQINWTQNIAIIQHYDQISIVPRSYILMIHNKLCDWMSVCMLSAYSSGLSLEKAAYKKTWKLYSEMISLAVRYENSFYTIIKNLEGFVAGELLIRVDGSVNSEFLTILNLDVKKDTKFRYVGSKLQRILKDSTTPLLNEFSCMMKLLGHPFVDMQSGSKAIHKKTTEKLAICPDKVMECVQHCKRDFIKSSIMKHRKWPLVAIDPLCGDRAIAQACLRNLDPDSPAITRRYGPVVLDDYNFITILPAQEFNYLENYMPYLKDKTVTVLRDKIFAKYINCTDNSPNKWKDTRMLLVYLMNPSFLIDHVKYIKKYMKSATLDDIINYLVIRLVPKEKELKIDFRGFGCRTYEDRARSLAQEKNVMRFLDMYSDEQAMTIGELDMLRKLYSFRTIHKAYIGYTPIYISLDASSWNNKFRHEVVAPVCQAVLDPLFDTNIFSKTQLAFKKGLTYVPDEGMCYYWDGQEGGIEGQNQDTWVVTYLAQVKASMPALNVPYLVFCKGDDFRLIVMVPPTMLITRDIIDIKNEIVTHISENIKKLGHTIKIAESFGSCKYFVFSKNASIQDIELPQSYRKIQKCYGSNNAFLPTLDEYIGISFSNGHSACKVTTHCMPCYMVALNWANYYLESSKLYDELSPWCKVALMLAPNLVGGFPIIYYHNYFVRAESDLFSPFLHLLQYTTSINHPTARFLLRWMKQKVEKPKDMFQGLLADAYCLPIRKPSNAKTILRQQVLPNMMDVCQNEWINELYKASKSRQQKEIEICMYESNTYNTKIMSAIASATPKGLITELTRQFETGRSILELLVIRGGKRYGTRILRNCIKAEVESHKHRVAAAQSQIAGSKMILPADWMLVCPGKLANDIRSTLWGKHIEGVTMPPLQHQVTLRNPDMCITDEWAIQNHFNFVTKKAQYFLDDDEHPFYSSSRCTPFLGYTTSTSSIAPTIHFVRKDVMLSKVKELMDLHSWVSEGQYDEQGIYKPSTYPLLIETIIKFYTDTPFEVLSPFASQKRGGTTMHHVRSRGYKTSIVPNNLSNVYLRNVGESNSHTRYRNSADHFHINMLHVYSYCVSLITDSMPAVKNEDTTYWGVTVDCEHCNTPILETSLRFDQSKLPENVTMLKNLKLGKLSKKVLEESLDISSALEYKSIEVTNRTISFEDACFGMLQDITFIQYTQKCRYEDRYTQHTVNWGGYQSLLPLATNTRNAVAGRSELKRIPMNIVVRYLQTYILMVSSNNGKDIDQHSMSLYVSTTPSTSLPWYGLVLLYHELGLSQSLASYMSKLSSSAIVLPWDSPDRLAKTIGLLCVSQTLLTTPVFKVVILSYYEVQEFAPHIMPWLIYSKQVMLKDMIYNDYRACLNDYDAMKYVIKCAILICLMPLMDNAQYELHIITQIKSGIPQITCESLDFIDIDIFEELTDDMDEAPPILKWMMTYYEIESIEEELMELASDYQLYAQVCRSQYEIPVLEIVYSDAKTCIDEIKLHDRLYDIRTTLTVPYDNDRLQTLYRTPTSPFIKRVSGQCIPSDMMTMGIEMEDVRVDHLRVECSRLYTPYGMYTTNSSAMYNIFHEIINPTSLLENMQVICLGDGRGGQSGFWANHCTNSTIVFNTLPPDMNHDYIPLEVAELCERNKNYLDVGMIQEGLYDLTMNGTYSRIIHRYNRFDIVCYDAEDPHDKQSEMSMICILLGNLDNLCKAGGMCYIRVDNVNSRQVEITMMMLTAMFEDVYVYKPPALMFMNKHYIIGINKKRLCQVSITSVMSKYLNFNFARSLRRLYYDIYEQIALSVNPSHNLIHLDPDKYHIKHDPDGKHYSPMWVYLFTSRLNLIIESLQYDIAVYSRPNYSEQLADWIIGQCEGLLMRMKARPRHYHDLTQAQLTNWTLRYMTYIGFVFIITSWNERHITVYETEQAFISCLNDVPRRLNWSTDIENYRRVDFSIVGCPMNPYYSFLRGIECGLSYWTWAHQ